MSSDDFAGGWWVDIANGQRRSRAHPRQLHRVRLPAPPVWDGIAECARDTFDRRGCDATPRHTVLRWKVGDNSLDRLLARELCVLAWAAEQAPDRLNEVCARWEALRPGGTLVAVPADGHRERPGRRP
jgi:hypothetical protein